LYWAGGETLQGRPIIDSRFDGGIVGEVKGMPAVHTTVKGCAWITGLHHCFVDPNNPWPTGYVAADT
jgi:trans-L-3-hydroxyproline dehydratase